MNASHINWGIIGCGDVVARKAATGIQAAPKQRIVSAMRRDQALLADFAERFQVPHTTTDPQAVIDHPEVNMVYIATPPDLHLEYARRATEAGKGVLIEKPAGRCARETAAIAELCRQHQTPGFASYYRRYQPKFQKVQQLIASGAIGPVVAVRYEFRERGQSDGWRQEPARSGGGSFYDLAGHVLDLIDLFCGPLEFLSGQALNLRAQQLTESFTQLSFRCHASDGSPAHGFASWNFAAIDKADELVIEGYRGRIRCQAMKQSGEVIVETDQTLANTWKGSPLNRARKKLRNRFRPLRRQRFAFDKPEHSHAALFTSIGEALAADESPREEYLAAAVRTAQLMDGALEQYYGGRELGFWEHPEHWHNLSGDARRRAPKASPPAYRSDVTEEQLRQFRDAGYAGPFRADVEGLASVFVPEKERKDVHLKDPQMFRLCTHPSITERVAALIGSEALSIFKTRIHTKVGETLKNQPKHAVVPWHQDVGDRNGGYDSEGQPVPTYTVWLALDDVGPEAGPLCVLPGTHTKLYGNYQLNFHAGLIESGDITEEDLEAAVPLTMKRGEFCVFHSWLLHGSAPNKTQGRRTGLNIRYVENARRGVEDYDYIDLTPWHNSAP